MKAGWIFPQAERCGISIYSRNYINALRSHLEVIEVDPADWLLGRTKFISELQKLDLIHIQYETSFFLQGNHDFYLKILHHIKKPLFVSLHEVYKEFPGVFPRDKISGSFLVRPLKNIVYDLKHPAQSAYRKHLSKNFGADCILVHHDYHKNILIEKGVPDSKIEILRHPVQVAACQPPFLWSTEHPVHLGSTGFINPQFDYGLLCSILKKLDIDWKFTWIGGVRSSEHECILDELNKTIKINNWEDRFKITGWVSEQLQDQFLQSIDIYLALFSSRSSSGSLARALGALKPILATCLPMTNEIAPAESGIGPLFLVPNDSDSITVTIKHFLKNDHLRNMMLTKLHEYIKENEFKAMASKLYSIYRKVLLP